MQSVTPIKDVQRTCGLLDRAHLCGALIAMAQLRFVKLQEILPIVSSLASNTAKRAVHKAYMKHAASLVEHAKTYIRVAATTSEDLERLDVTGISSRRERQLAAARNMLIDLMQRKNINAAERQKLDSFVDLCMKTDELVRDVCYLFRFRGSVFSSINVPTQMAAISDMAATILEDFME